MKTIISAICLVAWTALAFLSASAHAQEVRRAIPVVTPVPNSPLLTPEGTDKIIREVFANGRFSNLILLDHDAVFTPYKPHRTREMDLYDLRTLIEDGQDRPDAERSLQAFSPFFAAKVIYGLNRGYGYSQGPFEMMLTVTPHTGGYTWKYYRNYADFMDEVTQIFHATAPPEPTPTPLPWQVGDPPQSMIKRPAAHNIHYTGQVGDPPVDWRFGIEAPETGQISIDFSVARQQIDVLLQVELNTGIVREINAPLTPIAEQHRIVSEIEKHCPRLEAGIGSLKRVQQAALKRYRACCGNPSYIAPSPEPCRPSLISLEFCDTVNRQQLMFRR